MASPLAYLAIFIFLILCGLGNPIPEDTVLIAAGYLAYSDVVNIYYILAIGYVGVLAGDILPYFFGRKYGQKIINHPKLVRWIPQKRIEQIRRGFNRWGLWMVFFARFLVGFRFPTFLLSGIMKLPFKKFLLIDALGALLSVPIFVGLGYLLGTHIDVIRHNVHKIQSWVTVVALVLIALFIFWRWLKSRKEADDIKPVFLAGEEKRKSASEHSPSKQCTVHSLPCLRQGGQGVQCSEKK